MSSWTHPSKNVVICDTWIPPSRCIFNPSCCGCDSDRQHATPFSGAGLMTGLWVFLNNESPVTQFCLFLIVVCILCDSGVLSLLFCLLSADLSPFCSHPLTQSSAHWPHFSSDSSLLCLVFWFWRVFLVGDFSFSFLPKCSSLLPFHSFFSKSFHQLFLCLFSFITGFFPPLQVSPPTQEPASHRKVPTFGSTLSYYLDTQGTAIYFTVHFDKSCLIAVGLGIIISHLHTSVQFTVIYIRIFEFLVSQDNTSL